MRFPVLLATAALTIVACRSDAADPAVPILLYHRLGPARVDSTTVTTAHFVAQLDALCRGGFSVIPLSEFVEWRLGRGPAPPARSVVLTFDDGHSSVYRDARTIVLARRLPVTLFIYPSCISRASYAMTWAQVAELASNRYFTIQSHTYWHPNFKNEAKRLDEAAYRSFVDAQLQKSKAVLSEKLQQPITLLAWPFGIYDSFLLERAEAAGYEAGFSIECRAATQSDPVFALPRCVVPDEDGGPPFIRFIESAIHKARN